MSCCELDEELSVEQEVSERSIGSKGQQKTYVLKSIVGRWNKYYFLDILIGLES